MERDFATIEEELCSLCTGMLPDELAELDDISELDERLNGDDLPMPPMDLWGQDEE